MTDHNIEALRLYAALAPRMTVECGECAGKGARAPSECLTGLAACPTCHGTGKVALLMDGSIPVNHFLGDGTPIVPLDLVLETAAAMGIAPALYPPNNPKAQWGASGTGGGQWEPTATLAVLRALTAALDAGEAGK